MDSNSIDNKDDGQEKKTTIGKAAELASNKKEAAKADSSSSQPSSDTSDESSIDSSKKESSELGSSEQKLSEQESSKKEFSQKEPSDAVKAPEKKKMSDQVKIDQKSVEKEKATKVKTANTKASGGGGLFKTVVVLLLLLILAAAGAAGWWFYQQYQQQQQQAPAVEQSLADQQQNLERLEQRLNDERSERQSQQQAQAGLSQSINEVQLKINSHARRLRELSTTSRNDWLLAEAEYLIRLANQRLITERNTKNSTSLLITADGILRDLDEVDLLPVREALAKSITALRSAQMVDREGLYLQLKALSEQLVNLPLIELELEEDAISDEGGSLAGGDTVDEDSGLLLESWRDQLLQGFSAALDSASDLIRVRRRDTPLEPLPSVEEDHQVRYNLAIMLEQSQMALLREEQAIYETSLQKARQWLNSYFELNESAAPLVDQLAELEQENVVQQLPDISEGLEVLRDYIDSWHKRHIVQNPGEAQAGEQ